MKSMAEEVVVNQNQLETEFEIPMLIPFPLTENK